MDLASLIKKRRTIHNYTNESVALDVLKEAIQLGLFAPNHKNTKPWLFYRLGQEARAQVVELAVEINRKKAGDNFTSAKEGLVRKKFSTCAEIIVVGRKPNEDHLRAKEDYASVACAIQNIALFLWDKGLGTKWSTGALTKHEGIYKIIGCKKEVIELEGFLWIGNFESMPKTPEKLKVEECFFETK